MNISAHTIHRLILATALSASLAVLAIPAALAGGPSDTIDPWLRAAIASHRTPMTDAGGYWLEPAIAAAIVARRAG